MDKQYLDCICVECDNNIRIKVDDESTIHIDGGTFEDTLAMRAACNECSAINTLPLDAVATIYSWAGIDTEEDMQHISLLYADKTKELLSGQSYNCPKCGESVQVFVFIDNNQDEGEITGQITTLGGTLKDDVVICGNCQNDVIDIK